MDIFVSSVAAAAARSVRDHLTPAVAVPAQPAAPATASPLLLAEPVPNQPPLIIKAKWNRLAFAALFLFGILAGGIIAAVVHADAWSTALLHSFETFTGIAGGLLGGEITAKTSQGSNQI